MSKNNQKSYWIVDAVLFTGLICAFFMDETGLPFHQWLGIAVGVLSNYHLLTHWRWVKATSKKFFSNTNTRSRVCLVIDALLGIGMTTVVATGLVISTWLNLNLANYLVWKTGHIVSSVITLLVTLIKIGIHWKWIVKTAQRFSNKSTTISPQLAGACSPVTTGSPVGRREFIKMMGVVSLATVLASLKAFDELEGHTKVASTNEISQSASLKSDSAPTENSYAETATRQPTSEAHEEPTMSQPTSTVSEEVVMETATPESSSITASANNENPYTCQPQCPKSCSYPGNCRRYTDSNGNGRCDFGECV